MLRSYGIVCNSHAANFQHVQYLSPVTTTDRYSLSQQPNKLAKLQTK